MLGMLAGVEVERRVAVDLCCSDSPQRIFVAVGKLMLSFALSRLRGAPVNYWRKRLNTPTPNSPLRMSRVSTWREAGTVVWR